MTTSHSKIFDEYEVECNDCQHYWDALPFCDKYLISSNGEVLNRMTNKMVKQRIGRDGRYLVVDLASGNERWYKRVHRLVAETFIPNPLNLPEVNHKDGNKLNNSIDNLEWCTHLENMSHAESNGLVKHIRTFTDEQVEYIRKNYIKGDHQFGTRGLARRFNVTHTAIRYILNGGYAHVGK